MGKISIVDTGKAAEGTVQAEQGHGRQTNSAHERIEGGRERAREETTTNLDMV